MNKEQKDLAELWVLGCASFDDLYEKLKDASDQEIYTVIAYAIHYGDKFNNYIKSKRNEKR